MNFDRFLSKSFQPEVAEKAFVSKGIGKQKTKELHIFALMLADSWITSRQKISARIPAFRRAGSVRWYFLDFRNFSVSWLKTASSAQQCSISWLHTTLWKSQQGEHIGGESKYCRRKAKYTSLCYSHLQSSTNTTESFKATPIHT